MRLVCGIHGIYRNGMGPIWGRRSVLMMATVVFRFGIETAISPVFSRNISSLCIVAICETLGIRICLCTHSLNSCSVR